MKDIKKGKVTMSKKITVVTAVYNGSEYIEDCIQSIMNQTYKNFEHIIMDGGSTDNTVEIAKKYESLYNVKVYSKKDKGMYDAIANGFDLATGDIYCWLNSDDMLMPWAFEVMQKVISETDAQWCMGFPTYWCGNNVNRCQFRISAYTRWAIKKGLHDGRILPFIQQESTFWTRDLWEKSRGEIIRNYKIAGDFQLWKNFANYVPLYKVNSTISGFRQHEGQKSEDKNKYYAEIGNDGFLCKILMKSKLLKIFDALLSLTKRKDRIALQDLYHK